MSAGASTVPWFLDDSDVVREQKIRSHRIVAPEVRGDERPDGLRSRDRLRELIEGKDILLETVEDTKGKYGRYLGEVWLEIDNEWVNINDLLVSEGLAEHKDY